MHHLRSGTGLGTAEVSMTPDGDQLASASSRSCTSWTNASLRQRVSWQPAAKARRLPAALPVSSTRSITWCSTAHACSGSSWRTKTVERSARITDWCFSLPAPRRRAES